MRFRWMHFYIRSSTRLILPWLPVLADLLSARIDPDELPDFILPMPLHPGRLRERGFNQATEIARGSRKKPGSHYCQVSVNGLKTLLPKPGCHGKNAKKIFVTHSHVRPI